MERHDPADVLLGAAAFGVAVTRVLARPATGALRVAWSLVPRSVPMVLAERGADTRPQALLLVRAVLAPVLRLVVDALVAAVDLTEVVRRSIDLDAIAADLDVDAVVARTDLDAAVAGVDLDAAVSRVDIAAILDRLDLDAVVARVDLDGAVAHVDIAAIIDRVDLDAIASRLDVDAVAARLDIGAIVDRTLARLDLAALALQVIDAIDLPEILRQSTGTVATEAVRGVRAESVDADEAVSRFVDRLLRRARPEGPATP